MVLSKESEVEALLGNIDVRSIGELLVLSSEDRSNLRIVVRQIEIDDGRIVKRETRVGARWIAIVQKPVLPRE